MTQQTDAQRLDEMRELIEGKRPALSFPAIDGLRLVLAQLDVANQTIAEYTDYIKDYELMLDQRDCTIRSNVKQIRELQGIVAVKDAEIERLRKIEEAAWKAVDTVPFSAHDIYQADARAMDNLSVVLEQNRGDNA